MIRKVFILLYVAISIVACSESDTNGDSANSGNLPYVGTKWSTTSIDWNLGDDWVTITQYITEIYFYSLSEGAIYIHSREYDTDFGSKYSRIVSFFNYHADDDCISLDYITDEFRGAPHLIPLEAGNVMLDTYPLQKSSISSSEKQWLGSISGTTGDCKWYYNYVGLYIKGKGSMADYSSANSVPWNGCKYNYLNVGDGVTHIGNYVFANSSLAEADLPYSSLISIGDYSFAGACISEIYLNDNITTIGAGAFSGCKYIQNIYLPEKLKYIGAYAFNDCDKAKISFVGAKDVINIGDMAFAGATVTQFSEMKVLESVGSGAFSKLSISKLILPNSTKEINNASFNGSFSEIRIGTGLSTVVGTPFYPARTGSLYVNLGVPLQLERNIIDSDLVGSWTLYVPKGSRDAYSKAEYWINFKSIVEDSSLESGNGTPEEPDIPGGSEDPDDGYDPKVDYKNLTYFIDGKEFKMILVDGGTLPPFYIMQTELPPSGSLQVADKVIGVLNANHDKGVIKSEFRTFLNTLREETGIKFRLPTTAEWLYAAKGGSKSKEYNYSGSNTVNDVSWYKSNSSNSVHDIATKMPNELGIYDMSGNYGELICDSKDDYNVDARIYGGCWNDTENNCKISSYKEGTISGNIPGSKIKEKNAFDPKYITVRLVYSVPN